MARFALTGTPGTGKTTISKHLEREVLHLSDLYSSSSDGKNSAGEWLVNIDILNKKTQNILEDYTIIEGHFSHQMDNIDQIIVLRCDPAVLKKRLECRGYSEEKIRENLEAEAIGIIFSEACETIKGTDLFQLDTTNLKVNEASKILNDFFNGKVKLDETIDYSERILEWY